MDVQCASRSGNNKHTALKPTPLAGSASIPTTSASKHATEPEQQSTNSKISFARGVSGDAAVDHEEQQSYLLLHLIRVLALYLYVYLVQNPFLVDDLLLQSGGATAELLTQASKLEIELHSMLLTYVENEIASNQFDGLVQEKHVFLAIKKLFRLEKVKAATQCQALVALLSTYLSLLQSPIVHCEPFSMLISTLEYLAKQKKKQDVSLPLLYPIVNAIDSLSIEQRECLDALTTFWKWLTARDPSEMILAKIVSRHHSVIIQIDDASPPSKQTERTQSTDLAELGACFVATLLHHSDHIFRHDPEYSDLQTPLESDTEDDESAEDVSEPVSPPSTPSATLTTKTPTLPLLNTAEVEVATPSPAKSTTTTSNNNGSNTKGTSKSKGRRKKKGGEDQKLLQAVASAAASAKQQLKKKEEVLAADVASSSLQPVNSEDESLPAVLCVTIAAAAGTIAAALCVIFT